MENSSRDSEKRATKKWFPPLAVAAAAGCLALFVAAIHMVPSLPGASSSSSSISAGITKQAVETTLQPRICQQLIFSILFLDNFGGKGSNSVDDDGHDETPTLDKNLDPKFVFFSSVPKTGSATMKMLLREVARKHGSMFSHHLLMTNESNFPHSPTFAQADFLVHKLDTLPRPLIYKQDVHFINFLRHGFRRQPSYLGVVRSPLARFRSRFNFVRNKSPELKFHNLQQYEPGAVEGKDFEEWKNRTLEECAQDQNDKECWPRTGDKVDHQVSYFCGSASFCSEFGSSKALAKAKENIVRFYPVVGTLERLEETLQLVEANYAPFMQGLYSLYTGQVKHLSTVETVPLSSRATAELEGWVLANDIELYSFVDQRMDAQIRKREEALLREIKQIKE